MTARTIGTLLLGAVLWAGAARAQSTGTSTGETGTGSTGSNGSGTSSGGTGGATGTAGSVTFDPAAQAAARLFGAYRVPGAAPLDTSGVYRVDTGSSPAPAGSGSATTGSTSGSSSTGTSVSTATGSSSTP